jgi:hypothetical protein
MKEAKQYCSPTIVKVLLAFCFHGYEILKGTFPMKSQLISYVFGAAIMLNTACPQALSAHERSAHRATTPTHEHNTALVSTIRTTTAETDTRSGSKGQSTKESDKSALNVIQQFLYAGKEGNSQAALELFSTFSFLGGASEESLSKLFASRRDVFGNLPHLTSRTATSPLQCTNIVAVNNTALGLQGFAESGLLVYGTIRTTNDHEVRFTANLVKESIGWKLLRVRLE